MSSYLLDGKFLKFRDKKTYEIWIGVMKARSCPSEPHSGGWGVSSLKRDWASHLKVSSNNTLITVLEMLPAG